MSELLPSIIEASEISLINESWLVTMAQRKHELSLSRGNHPSFISVFGSAMTVEGSRDWLKAYETGVALGKAGAVVLNGGYGGSMEAVSAGISSVGGSAVGITCNNLPEKGPNLFLSHDWLAERWDQRLLALVWLADGYIVLPGSSGTLVELSMVIETQLKGFISIRPSVCLGNFWKPVVQKIAGTEKVIRFATTPVAAAQLALGWNPVRPVRKSRNDSRIKEERITV